MWTWEGERGEGERGRGGEQRCEGRGKGVEEGERGGREGEEGGDSDCMKFYENSLTH